MGRISDSHGEMMDNAGYERGGDLGGGWSEHDSGDGYESTRDRMDRHISRYGKDESYTNAFNGRNSSGWGGGRSAISGAVNNTRSSIGLSKHNSLTNNVLASIPQETKPAYQHKLDDVQAKTWQDTLNNIKEANRPAIAGMSQTTNVPNVAMDKLAQRDFAQRTLTKSGLNAVGGFVSDMVNNTAKVDKLGAALGLSASGVMAGKLGNVVTDPKNNKTRDSLSLEDKMAYDMYTNRLQDQFNAEYNSRGREWGRNIVSGLGAAATLATGGWAAPASAFANTVTGLHQTVGSLKDMAAKNNLTEMQQVMNERDERMAQAAREREAERGKFRGDPTQQKNGILNTMYQRATKGSSDHGSYFNAIPKLTNFWKNITIK